MLINADAFAGRVALVTGASRGIGAAVAKNSPKPVLLWWVPQRLKRGQRLSRRLWEKRAAALS